MNPTAPDLRNRHHWRQRRILRYVSATNVVKGKKRNSLHVYDQRKRSPTRPQQCHRHPPHHTPKAPGEKLAFHPFMVSHVASPIDPPVVPIVHSVQIRLYRVAEGFRTLDYKG